MIEPLLKTELEPVARRQRRLRFWSGLAICWLGAALAGLVVLLLCFFTGLPLSIAGPAILLAALGGVFLVWQRSHAWQPDYQAIARHIESDPPELHALLLTSVEQQP